jgi:cyclophilin family peptidyl-prolyl cis-trans isomerase
LARKHEEGILAMAHTNHALIGSQFYIVLSTNNTKHLDGNNPCFGKVSTGMSVVARLGRADQILSISYHEDEISGS